MGPSGGSAILSAVQDMLQRRMQRGIAGDQNALAQRKLDQDENNESERSMSMLEKIKMQGDTALARATLLDNQKAAERRALEQSQSMGRQHSLDLQSHQLESKRALDEADRKSKETITGANNEAQMARLKWKESAEADIKRDLTEYVQGHTDYRAQINAKIKQYSVDHGQAEAMKLMGILAGLAGRAGADVARNAPLGVLSTAVPEVGKSLADAKDRSSQADKAVQDQLSKVQGQGGSSGSASGSTVPAFDIGEIAPPPAMNRGGRRPPASSPPPPGVAPPPAAKPSATPPVGQVIPNGPVQNPLNKKQSKIQPPRSH